MQAIQLPFALIPLLKFVSSKEIVGDAHTIGRLELIFLSTTAVTIVFANYYTMIPVYEDINFSNPLTYLVAVLLLTYFAFLYTIFTAKLRLTPENFQQLND